MNPALLEDVIMGCAYPEGEQGTNVARIASFRAGFPETLGGVTVNRFCGSSMTAIHFAAGQLMLGAGEAYIAAGVESMTRVPMGGFTPSPNPTLLQAFPEVYMAMGHTAEEVARRYEVSREDQDALAVLSHSKAAKAREEGLLADEIVPVNTPDGVVSEDGCIRPGTNMDALAGLKPAFGGVVTAGTSSPLTDGSAAVLVCTEDFARRHNLPMLARIKAIAVGVFQPVTGLPARIGHAAGTGQPGWRRAGAGTPAGRNGRTHHRQGGRAAQAHRRPLCGGYPMHCRRAGCGDASGIC